VLGGEVPDAHQVRGVDPGVREELSALVAQRVAQRDRPQVLDERDRHRRVRGDRIRDVPDVVGVEQVTVRAGLRTGLGERERGVVVLALGRPDADERTDERADLRRLVRREIAALLDLDRPVRVLGRTTRSIRRTASFSRSRSTSARIFGCGSDPSTERSSS